MSKEVLLNKLEKQFSYYELVDEMQETINYSKIVEFLENEKDQQIVDLEAKLAESEEKLSLVKNTSIYKTQMEITRLRVENADLKQQLAEKDEQLKELTECNQYLQIYRNQEKISFCIERLEKVKKLYKNYYVTATVKHNENCSEKYNMITDFDVQFIINRQIEELKKGNEVDMREIEFRGKSKYDNQWVYGFYSPKIWYPSFKQTPSIKNFKGSDVEIEINTLGEYLGIKDKNETKIFEGDIVRYEYEPDKYITGIMEYTCCGFHICTNADIYDFDEYCSLEVIGNIYDNSELSDKGDKIV